MSLRKQMRRAMRKLGKAVQFDGSLTSKVFNSGTTAIPPVTNNFKIKFQVQFATLTQTVYLFQLSTINPATDPIAIIYGFTGPKVEFYSVGWSGTNPRTAFATDITATNQWYDVEVSYDGTTLTGKLDGVTVMNRAVSFTMTTGASYTISIGATASDSDRLTGKMDNVYLEVNGTPALNLGFDEASGNANDSVNGIQFVLGAGVTRVDA